MAGTAAATVAGVARVASAGSSSAAVEARAQVQEGWVDDGRRTRGDRVFSRVARGASADRAGEAGFAGPHVR